MTTALARPATFRGTTAVAIDRIPHDSFVRVADLPGKPSAAAAAVSRAAKDGTLSHVRHGLYFKGTPTRYGPTRPSPEAVAREVLGSEGVGPAGFSAARALGLTTQIPARPEFAVAGPKPTGLKGVRVHQRSNMARRELRSMEVAVLEVLRDPGTLVEGSWDRLVGAVRTRSERSEVRMDLLAKAVKRERPATRITFERLRTDLASR